MKKVVLITLSYHGEKTLHYSSVDAYNIFKWAEENYYQIDWYVDYYPLDLIFDSVTHEYLKKKPYHILHDKKQLLSIVTNLTPYTVFCVSAHGSKQGLILPNEVVEWTSIYKSIKSPDVMFLLDCCYVPLVFPTYYENGWHLTTTGNIIYPPARFYLITARNDNYLAANSCGSYLFKHFTRSKFHKLQEWQNNFTYDRQYLHINSNVLHNNLFPLWIYNNLQIIYNLYSTSYTLIRINDINPVNKNGELTISL